MKVYGYRFTVLGLLGACLFCLMPPLAALLIRTAISSASNRFAPPAFEWALHPATLFAFAFLTLLGAVWMLIGREIVTARD